MAAQKLDAEQSPPAGVYIAGLLAFLLGAALAVVSLVTQPARELTREPDPDDIVPGEVIFIKGREGRDLLWQGKWEAIQTGVFSTMVLDESDLNAWARSSLAKMEQPENPGFLQVVPSRVNFRVLDDKQLQLGIHFQLPGLTGGRTFLLQLVGTPVMHGDNAALQVTSGHLGNAPLGNVPVFNAFLSRWTAGVLSNLASTTAPEPLRAPAAIEIAENRILLTAAN